MNVVVKHPHERHISPTKALRRRGGFPANIWVFDSPKNNLRMTIAGDVAFMGVVLLEGDIDVEKYVFQSPLTTTDTAAKTVGRTSNAMVYFRNGTSEWREFRRAKDIPADGGRKPRSRAGEQAQAAAAERVAYRLVTEKDLLGTEYRFDNWLLLCAAITRTRAYLKNAELVALRNTLKVQDNVLLGNLLELPGIDSSLMLGVIASQLQKGVLECDLDSRLLGIDSIISRRSK